MAIGARTRSAWMATSWTVLCLALAMYAGVRVGRPLYYTDGAVEVAGGDLPAAGMLRWRAPEAAAELPVGVTGRIARLPDGRLLFGRVGADGTSDLQTFDPERPDVPPEPAYGLNTAHNELAPAVAADGRVYFASDRPDGVGGYDLYVATWTPRGFGPATPLAPCNTAFDEADPAPSPDGASLVFARIDRRVDRGDDGLLLRYELEGVLDPAPLFAEQATARQRAVDRDPVFHPDGASLWFVRRAQGQPLVVCRSSRLGDRFAAPSTVSAGWSTPDLRSPLPSEDGREVLFVQPSRDGQAALLYAARAEELVPWWPGQAWLEWLLLSLILCSLALLLLLYFGQRWSALDLVAQCLLLSLLLHALLFLWLMGVEIAGALQPGDDDDGGMTVRVVTSASTTAASATAGDGDVAAKVRFALRERAFEVAAPGTETARAADVAATSFAVDHGAFASAATANASLAPAPVDLLDAAAAHAVRDGEDAAPRVEQVEVAEVSKADAAAERAAQRAVSAPAADASLVQVATPGSATLRAAPEALATPRSAPRAALPTPNQPSANVDAARGAVVMRDGLAHAQPAAVLDEAATVLAPASEAAAPDAPQAQAVGAPTRAGGAPDVAASARERVVAPSSGVRRAQVGALAAASAAAAARLPQPRPAGSRAPTAGPALRDVAADATAPSARGDAAPKDVASVLGSAPVAAAATAAPRTAELGSVRRAAAGERAPAVAVATPRSGLPRPASSELAARAARRAPAAVGARPLPQPKLALRGERPVGGGARGAAQPDGDRRADVAQAAISGPQTPGPAALLAARSPLAGVAGRQQERVVAPASSLQRGGAAPAAAGRAGPPSMPEPRSAAALRALPLRGPSASAGGAPTGAPRQTAPRAGLAALETPLPHAPFAAAVRSPQRGDGARRLGAAPLELAVSPPDTAVPRAPARAAAIARAAAPTATHDAYSNRFGPAKALALKRYGGSDATERAVRDGLRYLARVQNRNGSWGDNREFDGKYGFVYVGKTALCVLAFLGAGHTPTSESEHSAVVARAVEHLLSLQDADTGAFGRSSCYGHGITAYALAECYGLTRDERLLRPLEEALTWILANQGPRRDRRNKGGWGYFSPGLRAEDSYARVSVSAWMIMALESARLSGVELPEEALANAREYLELSYDQPNGWFRYNHSPARLRSGWPTLPASTPAGAFCLMLLGADPADQRIATAVDYTAERRPRAYRRYDDDAFVLQGQGNVYFWYYGSLCCFLAGGEAWERWNERLSTVLPKAQAADGSFPPIDVYAEEAGDDQRDRSYTTAMCVLSLEVYYRYFTPLLLGR